MHWICVLKPPLLQIALASQRKTSNREPAPSSTSKAEEINDCLRELEDVGARRDSGDIEVSDVEELSWDGLLIEEDEGEDEETMYWSE